MAISTSGIAQQSLQDAILDAIDYLTEEKMSKLTLDKTIVAIVVKRKDVLQNTYYIKYQDNSNLVATAQGDTVYKAGQQVYVLVPQNDLSKDKIILGTASSDSANTDSSFISSVLDDYTYTGESAFVKNTTNLGLDSYKTVDSGTIYVSDEFKKENADIVNMENAEDWWSQHLEGGYIYNDRFKTSAANSEKLMLRAEFRTDLPAKHRIPGCGGEYGVKALLSFNTNIVDCYLDKEGNVCDSLPEDGKTVYKKRHQLYTLESTSSSFVGQPLNYPTFTEQSAIFDFDAENFEGIDSVVVYSQGFPQIENAPTDTYDIFVRNVQIYTLAKITSVQGDYSLCINPSNLVFWEKVDGVDTTDSLSTKAEFRKKSLNLSSDSRMKFWWGAEDKSITSISSGYQGYLGSGWKYLSEAGNSSRFSTSRNENRAYENRYKCAAAYSGDNDASVILTQEFTVYNQAAKKDIRISSNLGTEFAFDNGSPVLICSIYNETSLEDSAAYRFVWSTSEDNGESRKIYSEKEASETLEYIRECLKGGNTNISVTDLATAQTNVSLAAGVEYGSDEEGNVLRNVLTLPISSIVSSSTVYCTVYDNDGYCVGTASIALKNSKSVEVAKYHIVISNGSQSFQYSEMGVSPCNADYYGQDYQAILPLSCHFYDPTGLEVPSNQYVIQWAVPTEDTFFVVSDLDLQEKNSAGDTQEWVSSSQVLEFKIQDKWRYAYTNRQITAIVTYHGEEFRKDTEFLFSKVGDNGTNGTDYVVKIVPDDQNFFPLPTGKNLEHYEQSCLPAVYIYDNGGVDTLLGSKPTLKAKLYQGGTEVTAKEFAWSIAKSGGYHQVAPLEISSEGGLSLVKTPEGQYYRGQIIRVKAEVNKTDESSWDTVYGFYPMPIVKAYSHIVSLDKRYTMQQVLYNLDGKFPQYDTDQGFKIDGIFECSEGTVGKPVDGEGFTVKVALRGGVSEDDSSSDLASCKEIEDEDTLPLFHRYIVTPKETYNGLYQNNGVYLKIMKGETQEKEGELVCEVWVPIYLSLNRYSLASLNAWDGNSIEIESDEKNRSYILAPQIGAGVKNDDNSFTGIVMGSRVTQVEETDKNNNTTIKDQNDVGLFGYSNGQQSIFLDAQTGKATFGLPENDTDNYRGRIVLDPTGSGRSTIANLTLASSTLFSSIEANFPWDTFQNEDGEAYDKEKDRLRDLYWPTKKAYVFKTTAEEKDDVAIRKIEEYNEENALSVFSPAEGLGESSDNYSKTGCGPYKDYRVFGAKIGIPYDQHGILISADPPYISVKGHPLNPANSEIKWENGQTLLKEGDALEVELDPNKAGGLFTIFRHRREKNETDEENPYSYIREPLVGIDELGNFYTNAVKQEKTSMTINKIGAFGETAGQEEGHNYMGVCFSYDDNSILKIFRATATPEKEDEDTNTYLTTGTSTKTEYPKGIRVNAKDFGIYVGDGGASKTTDHYFLLSNESMTLKSHGKDLTLNGSKASLGSSGTFLSLNDSDTSTNPNLDIQVGASEVNGETAPNSKITLSKEHLYIKVGVDSGKTTDSQVWISNKGGNTGFKQMNGSTGEEFCFFNFSESHNATLRAINTLTLQGSDALLKTTNTLAFQGKTASFKQTEEVKGTETTYCALNFDSNHDALLKGYNKLTLQGDDGKGGVEINTKDGENTKDYLRLGNGVYLHDASKNVTLFLNQYIGDNSNLGLHGAFCSGNIGVGSGKGVYLVGSTDGLRIQKASSATATGDFYGIVAGTKKGGHALEVDGHALVSGNTRVTGSLTTGEAGLTVGNKNGLSEGWFNEIQKFYNSGIGDTTNNDYLSFNGTTLKNALSDLSTSINNLNNRVGNIKVPTSASIGGTGYTVYSTDSYYTITVRDTSNVSHTIKVVKGTAPGVGFVGIDPDSEAKYAVTLS